MATIERLDAFALAYEEPHYRGAERAITLVRVETDEGAVGWGEGISQTRPSALASAVLIDEGMAPLVLGRDPHEVESIWHDLCAQAWWYGVEGIAAFAISAIDVALWDLKGKLLGRPVADLLGGQRRSALPAMASFIFDMEDLEWTLAEFAFTREQGYRIHKAGWGMHEGAMLGQDRERDLRFLAAVRETIGPEAELVVDVPGLSRVWDVPTAIRRLEEWERFDLKWVEQPLPSEDLAGYARLRAATRTPIGSGEDEWGADSYRHVIESGGVDVVQLDPCRCLGLTGARQVIGMVAAAGLQYSAHSWSGALNTAASLHMLAISEQGLTLDFKPHRSPMQHELVGEPWVPVDGRLELRPLPGLGLSVDEDAVAAYRIS